MTGQRDGAPLSDTAADALESGRMLCHSSRSLSTTFPSLAALPHPHTAGGVCPLRVRPRWPPVADSRLRLPSPPLVIGRHSESCRAEEQGSEGPFLQSSTNRAR